MKRSGQGYRLSVLSVQEEYDKRRKSSQLLPAITRTLGTHHRVDEVEPGAGPGEESNSWAITGSQAVNDHCDTPTATPQTTPTVITAVSTGKGEHIVHIHTPLLHLYPLLQPCTCTYPSITNTPFPLL